MTETKVYADDFKCSFGDSDQFIEFLKERKAQSTWLTAPSKSLQFRALKGNENLSNLYMISIIMPGMDHPRHLHLLICI